MSAFPAAVLLWALLLAPLGAPTSAPNETAADAALGDVRSRFAARPLDESEAALLDLARRWPTTEAGGRALLWAGDLAVLRRPAVAGARYREVAQRFPTGELHLLALRGEGNAALQSRRWSDAIRAYDLAAPAAPPLMAAELREKRLLAARERTRSRLEVGAWALWAAVLLYFCLRLGPRRDLALPRESWVLTFVFGVLLALAWGRHAELRHAIAYLGGGTVLLVTVAFARPWPRARRRMLIDGAVLLAAQVALVYAASRHAGVLHALLEIFHLGS